MAKSSQSWNPNSNPDWVFRVLNCSAKDWVNVMTNQFEPQIPAVGITQIFDSEKLKMYRVECQCGQDDDSFVVEIESDRGARAVSINTYATLKTSWWDTIVDKRHDIDNRFLQWAHYVACDLVNGLYVRCKLTRDVWLRGYVRAEATTSMTPQQTVNYANVLMKAVADVAPPSE